MPFDPNQPRVPKGSPDGGEWTNGQAGSKESAGPGGQADATAVPQYGKPAHENAVTVNAVHFSNEDRTTLLSDFYGTGGRGIERGRLEYADLAIQKRIYFYVDQGGGVQPEQSVGARGHAVTLRNLYEPKSDNFALWRSVSDPRSEGHNLNAKELAVYKAGYDGYYIRDYLRRASNGQPFGVAILLGRHAVPVKPLGLWNGGGFTMPPKIKGKP
jgi:hypothetical protein